MGKKKRVDSDESEEETKGENVEYSEDEQPVKPKKAKVSKRDDSEDDAEVSAGPKVKKDADKNSYFELSDTRRLTVRRYKGSLLVDIREYYKDKSTGEMKPGSKGISLNADQWKLVRENVDLIDDLIEKA